MMLVIPVASHGDEEQSVNIVGGADTLHKKLARIACAMAQGRVY